MSDRDATTPETGRTASDAVADPARPISEARSTTPKISFREVRKSFRRGANVVSVLDGFSLDVAEREFVAIVGPSGCGKTTVLNCIAGFEPIDSGSIEVDGIPVRGPSSKRVFVFQEPGIFPWLTAWDNIGFGLAENLPPARRDETIRRYLDLVGLQGFERAYPSELSGGMKQRVEFARALAVDADVLYLDEPFGALDALTRLEMRREIVRISNSTGKTCILVTHDVEEACELADRIAVMSRRPATIQEVIRNPLPHPRDPDAAEFRELKGRIFKLLGVERRV